MSRRLDGRKFGFGGLGRIPNKIQGDKSQDETLVQGRDRRPVITCAPQFA